MGAIAISAKVASRPGTHGVTLTTGASSHAIEIAPKADGRGSSANGGELLCLALATCYCNDLYREAERAGIALDAVEVEASATFPGVGLAATNIRYRAAVSSPAPAAAIAELIRHTDAVAEVHNTVRAGVPVELAE